MTKLIIKVIYFQKMWKVILSITSIRMRKVLIQIFLLFLKVDDCVSTLVLFNPLPLLPSSFIKLLFQLITFSQKKKLFLLKYIKIYYKLIRGMHSRQIESLVLNIIIIFFILFVHWVMVGFMIRNIFFYLFK